MTFLYKWCIIHLTIGLRRERITQTPPAQRDIRHHALDAIPREKSFFGKIRSKALGEVVETDWDMGKRATPMLRTKLLTRLTVITDATLQTDFDAVTPINHEKTRFSVASEDAGAINLITVRYNKLKRPDFYIVSHYVDVALEDEQPHDTDPADQYTVWHTTSIATRFEASNGLDVASALARLPKPEAA